MELNSCAVCGLQGKCAKIYQKKYTHFKSLYSLALKSIYSEQAIVIYCNYFAT